MSSPEVAVLVTSFNRPRMLREALASIKGADEIVVLDDGSNFDVDAAIHESVEFKRSFLKKTPRVLSTKLPPLSVEERMGTPSRVGGSLNAAIRATKSQVIAYLCDDDLFHPEWIAELKRFFASQPAETHVARGSWGVFEDGKSPMPQVCMLGEHGMTMGNFAHRRSCCVEHGLWWREEGVAVPDHYFVRDVAVPHPWPSISVLPVMAGWRRLHGCNMLQFSNGMNFTPAAAEVLGREALE